MADRGPAPSLEETLPSGDGSESSDDEAAYFSPSESREDEDSSLTLSPPPAKKVKLSSTVESSYTIESKSSLTLSPARRQQSGSMETDSSSASLNRTDLSDQPSLEEVLRGIPPEKVNQPCQDKHLCEVACHVTNWLTLAPFLKITKAEEKAISSNWPQDILKQSFECLRKWQEKYGQKATYRRLCKAFLKVHNVALAVKVCDILSSQSSSSSEGSEDEGSSLIPPTKKTKYSSTIRPTYTTEGESSLATPPAVKQQPGSTEATHPLATHAQYLRDMYGRMRPLFPQWPPPPTRKIFNLAMIHSEDAPCGPINEELVRLLQRGKFEDFVEKRALVKLQNLFELDNEDRKIILIEGAPGSGKSTLAWHACKQWKARKLFQEFRIVVFIQLRNPNFQSAQSIADLLPAGSEKRKGAAAEAIKAYEGKEVLFIMDGWDEYGPGLETDSIVSKLICNPNELNIPYSTLLITSRPIASDELRELASSRVEIVGFSPEEVSQYFKEVLKHPSTVQTLQAQLKDLPVIEASCYLPLNAVIVAHLFKCNKHTLPRTLHGVFSALICHCIIRYVKKKSKRLPYIPSLNELPTKEQPLFDNLCQLAYKASMENKATFSSKDLSSYGVSVKRNGLGLMQVVPNLSFGNSKSYHFLHLSVQELLAAVHVSKFGPAGQVNVFHELFRKPRLASVFRFYSALTKLKAEGIREVIATVIGRRPGDTFSPERKHWRQHVLNILHCLYEAQDVSLCLFVASLLDKGLDLREITLSPLDCLCVGYFLSCVCSCGEEYRASLRGCSLDNYSVGFLVKELGKCGGSNSEVVGCLGLNLRGNDIDGSGVHLICDLMMNKPRLIRLRLNLGFNEKIGKDGLLCLLHMLCSNRWLCEINLMYCNLIINAESGPLLVEMLHRNFTLKKLELGGNEIGDIGVGYIVDGMISNSGVVGLVLMKCGIEEEGGKLLGRMLTKNTTLKHLDVSSNAIGDIGVSYIVDGMVGKSSGVVRLELHGCGIGEEGGKLLGRMLTENKTLEHLSISRNEGLGDVGIKAVSEGLKANCKLEELVIWECGYSLEGLKEFVSCLKNNSHLRRLEVMDKKEVESVEEERAAVNDLRQLCGGVNFEIVNHL